MGNPGNLQQGQDSILWLTLSPSAGSTRVGEAQEADIRVCSVHNKSSRDLMPSSAASSVGPTRKGLDGEEEESDSSI